VQQSVLPTYAACVCSSVVTPTTSGISANPVDEWLANTISSDTASCTNPRETSDAGGSAKSQSDASSSLQLLDYPAATTSAREHHETTITSLDSNEANQPSLIRHHTQAEASKILEDNKQTSPFEVSWHKGTSSDSALVEIPSFKTLSSSHNSGLVVAGSPVCLAEEHTATGLCASDGTASHTVEAGDNNYVALGNEAMQAGTTTSDECAEDIMETVLQGSTSDLYVSVVEIASPTMVPAVANGLEDDVADWDMMDDKSDDAADVDIESDDDGEAW
jgi:hypothetical protein